MHCLKLKFKMNIPGWGAEEKSWRVPTRIEAEKGGLFQLWVLVRSWNTHSSDFWWLHRTFRELLLNTMSFWKATLSNYENSTIFFVETPENREKLGNKTKIIYNAIAQRQAPWALWYITFLQLIPVKCVYLLFHLIFYPGHFLLSLNMLSKPPSNDCLILAMA